MTDIVKAVSGILAIVLGIVVLAFPFMGLYTMTVLAGLGVLLIGIAMLVFGVAEMRSSKALGMIYTILGIVVLIAGLGLFGNIVAFAVLASFWLYLAGLTLIVSGIVHLFSAGKYAKGVGALGIVLGILYVIMGTFALNPFALAVLIGVWLIVTGASRIV
jgi:uncharacterized membrane protein HdeD (DUF308 family)